MCVCVGGGPNMFINFTFYIVMQSVFLKDTSVIFTDTTFHILIITQVLMQGSIILLHETNNRGINVGMF